MLVLLSVAGWCRTIVVAQHHIDPFAGSNCTCDTYCKGGCAINASAPGNVTLWRMTPGWRDAPGCPVLDLTNKNTGDIAGDAGFVLSRSNARSFFEGDTPNSTDLILQFTVEVDGQWGPYGACNPPGWAPGQSVGPNDTDFHSFHCSYDMHGHHATRDARGLSSFANPNGPWPPEPIDASAPPPPPSCSCPRMNVTVGREQNLHTYGEGSTTGHWFSTPENGQCNGTHTVGDGSGCTWRLVAMTKAINATCMYAHIDTKVEQHNRACFDSLPPDVSHLDPAYQDCFNAATKEMTTAELLAPWPLAFDEDDPRLGVCPPININW